MVRSDDGRVNIGWQDIAKVFIAMVMAASVPTVVAMIVMYGDVREIKLSLHYQGDELQRLDKRLTRVETKGGIEQ